jgi:hypothetical protein
MFTASPAEIVVAGLVLGSVVAWLDSLTNPPKLNDETSWGRVPETAKIKETLALPAPSVVLPKAVASAPPVQAPVETPTPEPKLAAAAMKTSPGGASRSGPKGKPSQPAKTT